MSGKLKMKIKMEDNIYPVESMDELTNNTLLTCYPDTHCMFTGITQLLLQDEMMLPPSWCDLCHGIKDIVLLYCSAVVQNVYSSI